MSRSFYFLSNVSQHLNDGGPSSPLRNSSSLQQLSHAVSIYQPISETQLILPDAARCNSVMSFLRLVAVPFNIAEIPNCHDASPSGTVPFIVAENASLAVAEWKPIVTWARMNGRLAQQSDQISTDVSLWSEAVAGPLHLAELEATFEWDENYDKYAFPRIGSANSWPLSWAIPRRRRAEALDELQATKQLYSISGSPLEAADRLLETMAIRLRDGSGWLASSGNSGPTEADCMLYGHLKAILETPLPRDDLRQMVKSKQALSNFCLRFHDFLHSKADGLVTDSTERPPSEHIVVPNGSLRTITREVTHDSETRD